MLVLSRRRNEKIVIVGPDGVQVAEIMVCQVRGDGSVRIGIEAPRELRIRRKGRDGQFEDCRRADVPRPSYRCEACGSVMREDERRLAVGKHKQCRDCDSGYLVRIEPAEGREAVG